MKRKLTAITLVCVLIIGMLAACGSKSDPIVGKWTLKEAKFGDMSMSAADLDLEFTIEFKADGTVELSAPEESENEKGKWNKGKKAGEYEISEDKSKEKVKLTLKDDKLTMKEEGAEMIFERDKGKKK